MALGNLEWVFTYLGWAFVLFLVLGTFAIIFTDIFRKLTIEQRVVFALVSPAVIGYIIGDKILGFAESMATLGVVGLLYLVLPTTFFYVQMRHLEV